MRANRNKFRSKTDAMNRRVQSWWCLKCDSRVYKKKKKCSCGASDFHYFPSEAEAKRFAQLKLELRCGTISNLELQPSYPFVVNDIKITTYKADFRYARDGEWVIEDVKGNKDYLTDVFKYKRKMMKAFYGLEITIT